MLSAPPLSDAEIIARGTELRPELRGKTLDEIKRALDIPILAKVVPDIIARALSIVPERQLYEMLRLDSLAAVDGPRMRTEFARDGARMWKQKAAQWRTAKELLRLLGNDRGMRLDFDLGSRCYAIAVGRTR